MGNTSGSGACGGEDLEKSVKSGTFDVNIAKAIKDVPVISTLGKTEIKSLAKSMQSQKFKPGEVMFKEGDKGDKFYVIIKGKAEVTTINKKGEPVLLATLGETDYCGEQSLLATEGTRNATITAVTDLLALWTDKKTFQKHLGKSSKVKFANRTNKRGAILTTFKDEEKDDKPPPGAVLEKDPETRDWLDGCVRDNLMFTNLGRDQRMMVINKMYKQKVARGTELIKQGDTHANEFYVIDTGSFDIYVDGTKVVTFKKNACFGELALMYEAPRAATVTAAEDSSVWVVKRNAFRKALKTGDIARVEKQIRFLKTVPEFTSLHTRELQTMDMLMNKEIYKAGTVVFSQGDKPDKFYVVRSGEAMWKKEVTEGVFESGVIKKGSYFGERAFLNDDLRAATIVAKTELLTLELSKADFIDILGPVDRIMLSRMDSEDKTSQAFRESIAVPGSGKKPGGGSSSSSSAKRESITDTRDLKICKLEHFKTIGVLGKGAFGTVTLVVDTKTNKSYALKAIKKHQIVELGQQDHIINEKDVMMLMNNPFLVNLRQTYKDKYRVYFLLDVCLGGELFGILRKARCFNEDTSRFFSACVIEAFAYMHGKNIIYRDLKPENLVLDNLGYLKVTDFGFAKKISMKTYTLCGTPDYLAPEIVTGQGHGKGVDWWTLGILIYEMLASFPPFYDDEALQTYRKIVKGRVKFPRFFSPEARDIIKAFLKNKPTKRLGLQKQGNIDLIRHHAWFIGAEKSKGDGGFNWAKLQAFKMKPPIKPTVTGVDDISNFDKIPTSKEHDIAVKKEDDFDDTF